MYRRLLVFINKVLIKLLRLLGKNGSALPGLIIERLDSSFLDFVLQPVQKNVVLITGTNGKTTTTKMVVTALRGTGARVVTNSTGSNMTRGLISALIEDMTYFGSLKPTDWFVFEMDEAYAPIFTKNISPRALLALNVLRDQLDRYGEIDTTANLIEEAAGKADLYIYNAMDPLLKRVADRIKNGHQVPFGVDNSLIERIFNETTIYGNTNPAEGSIDTDILLKNTHEEHDGQVVEVAIANKFYKFILPVKGFHNAINVTSAVGLLHALGIANLQIGIKAISGMEAPFGRGEKLDLIGKSVTVALVKNPSGFVSNLETFVVKKTPECIIFVVNDRIADGRDVSWLWDVSFSDVPTESKLYCSGIRAYDMALRLKHDGRDSDIEVDVNKVIRKVMQSGFDEVLIIPTYTALQEVRTVLSGYGEVARIW